MDKCGRAIDGVAQRCPPIEGIGDVINAGRGSREIEVNERDGPTLAKYYIPRTVVPMTDQFGWMVNARRRDATGKAALDGIGRWGPAVRGLMQMADEVGERNQHLIGRRFRRQGLPRHLTMDV